MKNKNSIYLYCFIVFLFFLIIGFIIPYTGDDWNNLLYNGTMNSIIKISVSNYNTFEGRFFSRIFDLIFNYYRPLWVIANACGMTFLYYFIYKITNIKRFQFIPLFIIECLLLIDEETFSQVYVWITGNTTYFIPMIFFIFLIYINRKIFDKDLEPIKYNKIMYILLPILSFVSCMFVENVSIGIITVYLLVIVYQFVRTKKLNKLMIISMFFSLAGLYLMLYSPGTLNRLDTMSKFSQMNLYEKIVYTFPRQFNYVFIKNSFLILLLVFISLTLIIKNFNGIKRVSLIIVMSIIPIITSLENIYYLLKDIGFKYFDVLLDCHNWYVFVYWIVFLCILIFLIIKYSKGDKYKLLFFFTVAIINNAAMLISPLAGGRTSFLSTIMIYICVIIIIDKLDCKVLNNKFILKLNKMFTFCIIGLFLSFYMYCYVLDFKREIYIKNQIKNNNNIIEIIKLPGKYLWNSNPYDEYHLYTFKLWYGIPESKKTIIKSIKECEL